MKLKLALVALTTLLHFFVPSAAYAGFFTNDSITIDADSFTYDKKAETMTATGHVKIVQGKQVITADQAKYYTDGKKIHLQGEVKFYKDDGGVYESTELIIDDYFASAIAKAMVGRLPRNITLTSQHAEMLDNKHYSLDKATYTACPCNKGAPLWFLESSHVDLDYTKERVKHQDVKLKLYDRTVLYLPFFEHSTPKPKRRSGFLPPHTHQSEYLGINVSIPYYYNIAPNQDLTLTTRVFSNQHPLVETDYRHLSPTGTLRTQVSLTKAKKTTYFPEEKYRGHLKFNSKHQLKNNWTFGTDLNLASDKSFRNFYFNDDESFLTNRINISKFKKRSFQDIDIVAYQSLREDVSSGTIPMAGPHYRYQALGEGFGGKYNYQADYMNLMRQDGNEYHRVVNKLGWEYGWQSASGYTLTSEINNRVDVYQLISEDGAKYSSTNREKGTLLRFLPQASLTWQHPWLLRHKHYKQIIKPTAQLILDSNRSYYLKQTPPNEDSAEAELADDNLFSTNRFNGYDRYEFGHRVNYGIIGTFIVNNSFFSYKMGQVRYLKNKNNFSNTSGMNKSISDYVGSIEAKYHNSSVNYRFRINKTNFRLMREELALSLKHGKHSLGATYASLEKENDSGQLGRLRTLTLKPSIALTDNHFLNFSNTRSMNDRVVDINGHWTVKYSGELVYQGECMNYSLGYTRTYSRYQNSKSDKEITFKLQFATLN